jgi:glycosyltransferase involved in cell wall biosynthesis
VNVGLVVPGFSADASDWCIPALRHLARTLVGRADDVRVIAIRYPYEPGRYTVDGAEVLALGGGVRRGAATLALWRDTVRMLRTEHRRRRFDVLHAFWATESGLLAALAGRMLRVPTLVSLAGGELVALHDIGYGDQRIAWERLKIAAALRLASGVSAGSRLLQGLAERHIGGVLRAPLGVDLTLFARHDSRMSRRVVHAGTLTPVKDQASLLRAFALVRQQVPYACLDIAGAGPLDGDLRSLAADLGLQRSVCFRGQIDHAELASLYRGAAAAVVSSRHEAQCMAALEAAACGVPVVGTRVGVLPEISEDVVEVGDVTALAGALASRLSVPPSPDATSSVRARFGLDACTDRFRELYARLAAA